MQLLPILPVGFLLQAIGLVRGHAIPLGQSIPMLIGSILTANPDIDLIGLIATAFLALGFIPYALQLMKEDRRGIFSPPATAAADDAHKEEL